MKKFLIIALFALVLTGLSVTASQAGTTDCLPGCPCTKTPDPDGLKNHGDLLGAIEDHNNAMRVREKSYQGQVTQENDNGLGMTCFDRSVALTARLGSIFSDTAPAPGFNGANTSVFRSPILSIGSGNDKYLLQALNTVVIPQVQNHVNDFPDSLSQILGADVAGAFMAGIMAAFNGFLAPVTAAINSIQTAVNSFNTAVSAVQTAMQALALVTGIPGFGILIPTLIAAINTAIAAVRNIINNALKIAQQALQTAVNALLGWLLGNATSTQSQSNAAGTGECDRLQQLWGNNLAGFGQPPFTNNLKRALVQTGRQAGTPYFSFAALLTKNPAGGGTELIKELQNATNNGVMTNALNDVAPGGPLSGPGTGQAWWPNPFSSSTSLGVNPICDPNTGAPCGNSANWLPSAIAGSM